MRKPHPSLSKTGHRPWPLPDQPWRWRQTWQELAFLHYRIHPAELAGRLPHGLSLETFDGSAWISVVPFRMVDVAPGTMPSPPPLRSFLELNLRTYVTDRMKSGVWFFSLDADNTLFVAGGRALYGLPYYRAGILLQPSGGTHFFSSRRWAQAARFVARYAPSGPVFYTSPGSFEHWITERYCLYAVHWGALIRIDVHHRPWPLQQAEAEAQTSELFRAASIQPDGAPPICHYSTGVEVISFNPERVQRIGKE